MATAKKSSKATKASTRSTARKTATKQAAAKKAAAKKAVAKKATAKKATATKKASKSTRKRSAGGRANTARAASRPATKKATARKAPARKAAKKRSSRGGSVRKPKSPFGAKFVADMKEKLEAERAKYLHSAEEYRAEAEALIEGREPGDVQFDEEGGEGDTLAVERERDLALSNQARVAVEQIDAALRRIAAGTYGLCVVSGLPIPQDRLRAIPWAAERVEYKAGGLGRF